jgi:hypothetical protein
VREREKQQKGNCLSDVNQKIFMFHNQPPLPPPPLKSCMPKMKKKESERENEGKLVRERERKKGKLLITCLSKKFYVS